MYFVKMRPSIPDNLSKSSLRFCYSAFVLGHDMFSIKATNLLILHYGTVILIELRSLFTFQRFQRFVALLR